MIGFASLTVVQLLKFDASINAYVTFARKIGSTINVTSGVKTAAVA